MKQRQQTGSDREHDRPRRVVAYGLLALLVSTLALVASPSSRVAAQPADTAPIYTERVEVRLIHLDVLVTGRGGDPVVDLTREDFEVRANGEPVEISLFAPPSSEPSTPDSSEGDADIDREPKEALRDDEWILYFDDENLVGANRQRVIRGLGPTLASWPSGTTLRLAYRRGSDSILLGPFDSPSATLEALEQRPKGLARGILSNRAREFALRNLSDIRTACAASGRSPCIDCWNEQLSEATRHAAEGAERVQRTVSGLANLLATLDPTDGQRGLIYVGDGLPQIPGASVFSSLGEVCPDRVSEAVNESLIYDQGRLLDQLGALANAQRVALHLIDAGGVRHAASRNDSEYNLNRQDGLLNLAKATGGSAVLNSNNPAKPLRAAVEQEQARYALGFTLVEPPNGQVYKLEVQLRAESRGRTLSYRRSFYDQLPQDRLLRRLTALLDPMAAGDLDPEIGLQIGDIETVDRRLRKVELRISVPEGLVVRLPGPGGESGSLGVALASADARGRSQAPRYRSVPIGDGGLQPAGGVIELVIGLSLPKGERRFALALLDENTSEEWFTVLEAEIR